ncbi:MAG TPA: MCE family protein [Pseudonocardia sp.]|jgi:virulence factor Mce-like protein|nr:MCE family protein [Pseudonocardia sp.]
MPYVADATGRGLPAATLARRGFVALLLVIAVIALLLMQYRGVFRSVFPATAVVTDVGDGVTAGADVKLRGALVGSVGAVGVQPTEDGLTKHVIDLQLRPDLAIGIPAGVTARVVPTNVFGAPSVELLDPETPTGTNLARGAVIQGDTSEATLQLQTVMTQLNKVLRAVHPAQLNVALTNIAQGLRGRGAKIGSIVSRLDPYLTTLNEHTDDFSADLRLLGTDLQGLADAAPALLDTVDNAVVTTKTIVDKQHELADTLTGATHTADGVHDFLSDNDDRIIRLVGDGRGVTSILADQHNLITSSLLSLGQGTGQLGAAINPRGGGSLSLQFTLTPFAPYTAADCPRYPGLNGPNCGNSVPPPGALPPSFPFYQGIPAPPPLLPKNTGDSDTSAQSSLPGMFPSISPSSYPAPGGTVGPVGSAAETRTIDALLGAKNGGAAGVLLLGPIVRGATVVVKA